MRTIVDARLREEASRYRLRFGCADCAYFDEHGRVCSEGYPTKDHEDTSLERGEVVFCKLFEHA